jgi:FkbM family methyltransferase
MLKRMIKRAIPGPLWWRLRLAWHWWRRRKYRSRTVTHAYGDTRLQVHLADALAEGWYDHDWAGPPEFVKLRQQGALRKGARVFDLGAHQGVVALMLADVVGPEGKVVAVEASPHNAAQCLRNRELNRMPWIDIVQAAVADRSGTVFFNRGSNGHVDRGGNEWGRVQVPAVTIDELTDRYGLPDLLFVDIEGFECQALRGAARTLASHPDCFVEVHGGVGLEQYGGSVEELVSHFPPQLYSLFYYTEGQGDLTTATAEQLPRGQRFFLLALRSEGAKIARAESAHANADGR